MSVARGARSKVSHSFLFPTPQPRGRFEKGRFGANKIDSVVPGTLHQLLGELPVLRRSRRRLHSFNHCLSFPSAHTGVSISDQQALTQSL